ncbi:hypothetical protein WMY93_010938 [Mugilogobius chulae]|uniref:Uncharacterized protein n=1 Tax=Mugilogobius chulae TaxID=88201 RepID=A0AAW0PHS9_9GOBI
MLSSCVRLPWPLLLPFRQIGTAAARTVVSARDPELLSATLAFEDPKAFQVKTMRELLRALGGLSSLLLPCAGQQLWHVDVYCPETSGKERLFLCLCDQRCMRSLWLEKMRWRFSQTMEKMSLLGLRPMLAVPIEEDLGEKHWVR